MAIDYTATKFWLDFAKDAALVGVWIYVWLSNRHRVTTERITKLEDHMDTRLDTHADRLTRLEVHAGAAPTHDDLNRLHQRLDVINGELKGLTGESAAARRTLDLIHDYLLNHGGKS